MPEIYRKWRNQLYYYLKDRIKGRLMIEINDDTASLYLRVDDDHGRFERGIFELDKMMLTGSFDYKKQGKWFLNQYKRWILSRYIREES